MNYSNQLFIILLKSKKIEAYRSFLLSLNFSIFYNYL